MIVVRTACPWCEYMNRSAAKFCGNCSRPLSFNRSCTQCGADNPANHRFCEACSAPLLADASPASVGQPAVEVVVLGRFEEPVDVTIHPPTGNITDPQFSQVYIISAGTIQASFGQFGSERNRFAKPTGLAIDPLSGELLIADADNNRILVFDHE